MSPTKNVLVTGATSGIGFATTRHLLESGWRVWAGFRRAVDGERLQALGAVPVRLDVTSPTEIEAAVAQLTDDLRGDALTGVVNNAGLGLGGPAMYLPLDVFRHHLEVNFIGALAVVQAFRPLLSRARESRVVNISSVNGRIATPFLSPYAASKFALEALSDSLRIELEPWGIRVVVLQLGMIETPIFDKGRHWLTSLREKLPAEALEIYEGALASFAAALERVSTKADPPEVAARAIERALTDARPRARYVVGNEARAALTLRWILPDCAFDRVMKRFSVIKRRP